MKGIFQMKSKIITVLALAALCASAITSCGTVENIAESSAPELALESSALDDSLEELTEPTEPSTETTSEKETSTTEASTETSSKNDNSSSESSAAYEPDAAPQDTPEETPAEAPVETPNETPAETPNETPAGSFTHDDMTFVYGGSQATVLVDASGLISALGAPSNVEEAPSCLSNGCDVKNYYYSGLTVYTYIDGDREIIYEIEMTSPSYTTTKGLATGMTVADAEALYGTNYISGGGVISYYDSGNTYMYLIVSGDTITSIGYAAEV